jgi:hypothetical protein
MTTPPKLENNGVLTYRQGQMWGVLDAQWRSAGELATLARVRTRSPRETASKYCDQLVRFGLAEKGGSRMFPEWRRA